jgi:hypothetical protein
MSMSPIHPRSLDAPRLPHRFAAILAVTLTFSAAYTQPAHAALPVAAILGFLNAAYEAYKNGREIIGADGPGLAAQLAAVQTAIINELRTQRNQELRATAEAGMNDFRTLGFRQPGDPANAGTWETARERMTDALVHYSIIVEEGSDVVSAYQLAPTYFALAATYAGLLQMKPEVGFAPSAWQEYHVPLQRAMNAGYWLVGAHTFACWAGWNPGRDGYDWSYPNTDFTKAYSRSQLYRHIVATKYYPAGPRSCVVIPPGPTYAYCNPLSFLCYDDCGNWFAADSQQMRDAAIESADWIDFGPDQTAQIVRGAMREMLKVGGGNAPNDFPRTDLPEASGMFVDPFVTEWACEGVSGGPWGYPIRP